MAGGTVTFASVQPDKVMSRGPTRKVRVPTPGPVALRWMKTSSRSITADTGTFALKRKCNRPDRKLLDDVFRMAAPVEHSAPDGSHRVQPRASVSSDSHERGSSNGVTTDCAKQSSTMQIRKKINADIVLKRLACRIRDR